jgi:hypothetical protein
MSFSINIVTKLLSMLFLFNCNVRNDTVVRRLPMTKCRLNLATTLGQSQVVVFVMD